jgi:hypothetical protein
MRFNDKIYGKNIVVIDGTPNISRTELQKKYISCDKISILRSIADFSNELFYKKDNRLTYREIELYTDFLNHFAFIVIKFCKGNKTLTKDKLYNLFRNTYLYYQEDIYNGEYNNHIKMLFITMYRQIQYQEPKIEMARAFYIYDVLWRKYNQEFNIHEQINTLYGFSFKKFITYGLMVLSGHHSYFYRKTYVKNQGSGAYFNFWEKDFDNFVNIVCKGEIDLSNYEGSLKNPIQKYPILKTNFVPEGQDE